MISLWVGLGVAAVCLGIFFLGFAALYKSVSWDKLSENTPFSECDGEVLCHREGGFTRLYEVEGVSLTGEGDREGARHSLNHALMSLSKKNALCRVYFVRRRVKPEVSTIWNSDVLQKLDEAWLKGQGELFETSCVVAISAFKDRETFNEICEEFTQSLQKYGIKILSKDDLDSFLYDLLNGTKKPNALKQSPLQNYADYIANGSLLFSTDERGRGLIQRSLDGVTYESIVSIYGLGERLNEQTLESILSLPYEMTLFVANQGMGAVKSATEIGKRKASLGGFLSGGFTFEEIEELKLIVNRKEALLSNLYVGLVLRVKNKADLENALDQVSKTMRECGHAPKVEGSLTSYWITFFAMPGFKSLFPRSTYVLTSNVAAFLSFSKKFKGAAKCSWGAGAINLFRTHAGTPYLFQLHRPTENPMEKTLAHSVSFAPSGGGKTTFWQHTIAGALKFENLRVFAFDSNKGMKHFTQKIAGTFLDPERDLELNPFDAELDDTYMAWLQDWLMQLSGCNDDDSVATIKEAIDAIADLPREERKFALLADMVKPSVKLSSALEKWLPGGAYERFFNGRKDTLDLYGARLTTFEMGELLGLKGVSTAFLSYVLFKIRKAAKENSFPHLVFLDEGRRMTDDSFFRGQIKTLFLEHRKLDGSINIVFQNPSDLTDSGLEKVILNNTATTLLFPNANASLEEYAAVKPNAFEEDFIQGKLTEMREMKRPVMVKKDGERVLIEADLNVLGEMKHVHFA